MAERFSALMQKLDAPGRGALRQDQRWFLHTLDEGFEYFFSKETQIEDLEAGLANRARFLDSIDPAPGRGMAGTWGNAGGEIEIGADGSFEGNAAEPQTGRWVCAAAGSLTGGDASARVLDTGETGWTIEIAREKTFIRVEERSPDGKPAPSPFCGHNGDFTGPYFRITQMRGK